MSASLIIPESTALAARSQVERMTGIEPALSAWEADVLPLNYIRRITARPPRADPSVVLDTSYRNRRPAWVILSDPRRPTASRAAAGISAAPRRRGPT